MPHNVRVLAGDQILSQNQGSERNEFTRENFERMVKELARVKGELLKQTKATNYYLRECNTLLLEVQRQSGLTDEISHLRIAI